MISTKEVREKQLKSIERQIENIEKVIDKELINLIEIPVNGIEIRLDYKISTEIGNRLAKLYYDGGWDIDIRKDVKSEYGPAPYNPQKQEETEVFIATVITLKAIK